MPRRELVFSLGVGALAAVLGWFRLDGRTRGVIWAEDGWFLQNSLDSGPVESVFRPYEGYLHVLPKTVVELATLAPLEDYAVAVAGLCCLVVGAVGALTYYCSRDVVSSRVARAVLGLVPVLTPTAASEVLGNTANLHWFLLWLTPWVLLHRPGSWRAGWAMGLVMLVITLSETQALLFLPLLLFGLRDRHRRPVLLAFVAGCVTQMAVLQVDGRRSDVFDIGNPTFLDLVQGYALHVFLQMFYPGTYGVGQPLVDRGWSLVLAASVPFLLVLLGLVLTTRRRTDWALTLAIGAGALVPFVAGVVLNFRSFLAFDDFGFDTLAIFAPLRYAIVPAMFVLAAAVVVADRLVERSVVPARALGAVLLVGVVGLGVWHLDASPTKRTRERGWSQELDRAAKRCESDGLGQVEVPTAPDGWEVYLACADVRDRSGWG